MARPQAWADLPACANARRRRVPQPDTRFRMASVSKIFAAAQTSRYVAAGGLAWGTTAFPFVGVTSALPLGTPSTAGLAAVTVQQLVLRTSGLPRDFDREPREIAATLGTGAVPIPRGQLLQYLYGLPTVGAIPAGGLYSNTAFYLLTSVVEAASGLSFERALAQGVLADLGITDVRVAGTAVGARLPNEVASYDHADVHASQLDYSPDALAPNAYGGQFVLENSAGAGGLLASAPSIARLIARYPVWNADGAHLAGREVATRYGTFDGTSSGAVCRDDGLDFAFLCNRRVSDAQHDELRDAIHAVLNAHAGEL